MSTCPSGHRSATIDFCDVCGLPLAAAGAVAPPVAPPSQNCPHCGAPRPPAALFCEACGYDYTTGALPTTDLAEALGLARSETEAADATGLGEVALEPADPASGGSVSGSAAAVAATGPTELDLPDDPPSTPPSRPWADLDLSAAAPSAASLPAAPEAEATAPTQAGPPTRADQPWVVEVWIDPAWYAAQAPPDPLPAVGPPRVLPLTSPALIGRRSTSRQLNPQIDCGHDVGCSRRQAELTQQAGQWYLTDLDSANGTFVAPADHDLPTQSISARAAVGPDDRIYLGAWTRLVIRPALPGEVDQDNLNA
ncbi:MAG: FHA domain-containing protein [Propionibacteriaceae bacterium]|jgi:hypothetical protein|nr:FHA domain-containing protein [Propionibacteriaceae bacterium]